MGFHSYLQGAGIDLVYSKNCFVAANKNTPDEICDIIEQAAVKALQNPEYIKEAWINTQSRFRRWAARREPGNLSLNTRN